MSQLSESHWIYSLPVASDVAQKTGCFTSLPIRIHKDNDIADKATLQSISDWKEHVGDGWEAKSGSAISKVGNWCAFIFPESLPERLASITYLANIGNIHDDATDDVSLNMAMDEHEFFSNALSVGNDAEISTKDVKTIKLRRLVSNCVLEILSIDRDMGMRMIESYQKKWLDVMEHADYDRIDSLQEYLEFRMLNGGMEPFWLMCQFGMGLNISDVELKPLRHIFEPAENALVLTNDYWSWGREYNAWLTKGSRLVNSIDLISRLNNISHEEAQGIVRDSILMYEKEYEQRKECFFRDHADTPAKIRKFIEVCGLVVAGNHYWCANCTRHHGWKDKKDDAMECQTIAAVADCTEDHSFDLSTSPSSVVLNPSDSIGTPDTKPSVGDMDITPLACKITSISPNPIEIICEYMASSPSKGIRSTIIQALNQWFQISSRYTAIIKDVILMLHNSSLILDDIQDQSPLRRGRPAAHTIFGTAQSINSATSLFVQSMKIINDNFDLSVQSSFLDMLYRMHVGQGYDLYWRFNLHCPTEDEYFEMVDQKTGCMFEIPLALMASKSKRVKAQTFAPLVRLFGRYFQVRDDYMNLTSAEYAQGKGACEDLDEGKLSYPLVFCKIREPAMFEKIIGIFRAKPPNTFQLSTETKIYIISLLKSSGALDKTLELLLDMESQLDDEVKRLENYLQDPNPMLRLLLQTLKVNPSSV